MVFNCSGVILSGMSSGMSRTCLIIPNTAGSATTGDDITRTERWFSGRLTGAGEAERRTNRVCIHERIQNEADTAKPQNQIANRTAGILFTFWAGAAGGETKGPATNGMLMSAIAVIGRCATAGAVRHSN